MKIIDFKKYAVGFVMGLCFVSGYTFASGINGTIWSLFEQISGGSWVLNWANIKSDTVDSDKIKSQTIVAGDIAWDTITSSELADSLYIQDLYSDNLYVNDWTTPKKVATEDYVIDKWYLTSVPSTYATKEYVTTRWYLTSVPSTYATKDYVTSRWYLTSVPSTYVTKDYLKNCYLTVEALVDDPDRSRRTDVETVKFDWQWSDYLLKWYWWVVSEYRFKINCN